MLEKPVLGLIDPKLAFCKAPVPVTFVIEA